MIKTLILNKETHVLFTEKNTETILFRVESKKYHRQHKILENCKNIFFLASQVVLKNVFNCKRQSKDVGELLGQSDDQ